MALHDPNLNQPQLIEYGDLPADARFLLANQDILFEVDGNTDLCNLRWPWADEIYAKTVKLKISELRDDEFAPMVTQFFPAYQETILGSEGIIVSKRLAVPYQTHYDRAVLWVLECQAEGDRLLRLEVEIDWGQPLMQRMVDGLLVAQDNPASATGLYAQRNADSTRVFGNPQARPSSVDLEQPDRSHLVYHVLINGEVEVPLLMTLSDVGEQVAWSGFLALRDAERSFQQGVKALNDLLSKGALWTSDPELNRAVKMGKTAAIRNVQRFRTGLAATDRLLDHSRALVSAWDVMAPTESQNLLAHLRRLAEKAEGRLPQRFTLRPKDTVDSPSTSELIGANSAYLSALSLHLRHRPAVDLLEQHYAAASACAEALVRCGVEVRGDDSDRGRRHTQWIAAALEQAAWLAELQNDEVNAVRWQSESRAHTVALDGAAPTATPYRGLPESWGRDELGLWRFAEPWQGIDLAGAVIWDLCGVSWDAGLLTVKAAWPESWRWWAIVDLPYKDELTVTLVWDGTTLHSTLPLVSDTPWELHQRIRVLHAELYDFDLQFEFVGDGESDDRVVRYRPEFNLNNRDESAL